MGNSLHGIRIGFAEISNFMIYYRVSRFAYLRMSCGCKTFLKLMINNNFEDQDLLQGSTIIYYSYLLLMLSSKTVFIFTSCHAILPLNFVINVQ